MQQYKDAAFLQEGSRGKHAPEQGHQVKEEPGEQRGYNRMGLITLRKMKAIIKEADLYPEGLHINDVSFCMRSEGNP